MINGSFDIESSKLSRLSGLISKHQVPPQRHITPLEKEVGCFVLFPPPLPQVRTAILARPIKLGQVFKEIPYSLGAALGRGGGANELIESHCLKLLRLSVI